MNEWMWLLCRELSNKFLYFLNQSQEWSSLCWVSINISTARLCGYSFIHALSITEASGGPDSETHYPQHHYVTSDLHKWRNKLTWWLAGELNDCASITAVGTVPHTHTHTHTHKHTHIQYIAALPTILSASNHEFMSSHWHTTSMCTYSEQTHTLTHTLAHLCRSTTKLQYTHPHTRAHTRSYLLMSRYIKQHHGRTNKYPANRS